MIGGYHRPDRSASVAIGLTVISFLLMTFDIRSSQSGVAETLRNGAQTVAAPVQQVVNAVVDPIVDFADGLANLAAYRTENERLRAELEEARADSVRVASLEAEIELLRSLQGLQLANDLDSILIPAEVTGRAGALDLSFTIDQGSADGVLVDFAVINLQGALVGIVSSVTDTTATVVPITARSDAPGVRVRVGETAEVGIITGQGTDELVLSVFDAVQPVKQGMLVRTRGSDRFPPDLDVGLVLEDAVPLAQVIRVGVEPLVDIDRLRFVGVVPWPPEEVPVDEPEESVADEGTPSEGDPNAADGDDAGTGADAPDGEVSDDATPAEGAPEDEETP
jgi:rod shape-determining protein MreC